MTTEQYKSILYDIIHTVIEVAEDGEDVKELVDKVAREITAEEFINWIKDETRL